MTESGERQVALRCMAVVPTYRPGADVPARLAWLRQQVDGVIVVDDGSPPEAATTLLALEASGSEVIRLGSNRGIAAALNVGARRAIERYGADLVLTVDQDTELLDHYVAAAKQTWQAARARGVPAGLVVAGEINGRTVESRPLRGGGRTVAEPIQSGMLIATETFRKAGWFDEELFIDCVDTDFGLRARRVGLETVVSEGSAMRQQFGATRRVRLLGRDIGWVIYPPMRHYYIARNRVVVYRRHGRRHRAWMVRNAMSEVRRAAMSIMAGPARAAKVRATLVGLRDGARDRLGKRFDAG